MDRNAYNNLVWDGYISDTVFNNQNRGDVRTLETWATTVEILFALNRYRDMFNHLLRKVSDLAQLKKV